MARFTVTTFTVDVLGRIWMPNCKATMQYTLNDYDRRNLGEFTRENVEQWLSTHAGDFQQIIDFSASLADVEIPWVSEENEAEYNDIAYPYDEF